MRIRLLVIAMILVALLSPVSLTQAIEQLNPGHSKAQPREIVHNLGSNIMSAGSSVSGQNQVKYVLVKIPKGVVSYVPVNITNSQSSGTTSPYNQLISVKSAHFTRFESPNLQNVEWFTGSGEIIPSWIEAGNSNTCTTTLYWLKIPFRLSGDSTETIYMGFVSKGVDLFNPNGNEGEAPQLTSLNEMSVYDTAMINESYAIYDNGANVFPIYFNGNTPLSDFSLHSSITLSRSWDTFGNKMIYSLYFEGTTNSNSGGWSFQPKYLSNGSILLGASFEPVTMNVQLDMWGTNNVNSNSIDSTGIGIYSNITGLFQNPTYYLQATDVSSGSAAASNFPTTTVLGGWLFLNEYMDAAKNDVSGGFSPYGSVLSGSAPINPIYGASQVYASSFWQDSSSQTLKEAINYERICYAPPNGIMPSVKFLPVHVFNNSVGYAGNSAIYMSTGINYPLYLGNATSATGLAADNFQNYASEPKYGLQNYATDFNTLQLTTGKNASSQYSFSEVYDKSTNSLHTNIPINAVGGSDTQNETWINNITVWRVNVSSIISGLGSSGVLLKELSQYETGYNFTGINYKGYILPSEYELLRDTLITLGFIAADILITVFLTPAMPILSAALLDLLDRYEVGEIAGYVMTLLQFFTSHPDYKPILKNYSYGGSPLYQNWSIWNGSRSVTQGDPATTGYNAYMFQEMLSLNITSSDFGKRGYLNTTGVNTVWDSNYSLEGFNEILKRGASTNISVPVVPAVTIKGGVLENNAPIPDKEIVLTQSDPNSNQTNYYITHSASNGTYRFMGEPGKMYSIQEYSPIGMSDAINSTVNPLPSDYYGTTWLNLTSQSTTVTGTVVNNANGNAIADATVTLNDSWSSGSLSTTTNSDGIYFFSGIISAGTYTIAAYYKSGSSSTSVKVNSLNGTPEVPTNVQYYIPFTLTNTQSVATPNPYNQMIQVDSSAYSSYEATNLQNVEWFTSTGAVIPSWIESGNILSSTDTVYWLKMPFSLGPSSSATVYMGFASTSTNLFTTGNEGVAPELTSTYGQYDNGANVFLFYDNFAGTSLNTAKWQVVNQDGGTYTVNNGISLTETSYKTEIHVLTKDKYSGIFDARVTSQNLGSYRGTGLELDTVLPNPSSTPSNTQDGYRFIASNNHPYYSSTGQGGFVSVYVSALSTKVGYNSNYPPGTPYIMSVDWPKTGQEIWQNNYNSYITSTNTSLTLAATYDSLYAGSDGSNHGTISYSWARVRSNLPNNVMPTVSSGGSGGTITAPTISIVIPTYGVQFDESGLPSGTTWSVTFDGASKSSTSAYIGFSGYEDGSFSWSTSNIIESNGSEWEASPISGTININGGSVLQDIKFTWQSGGGGGCVLYGTMIMTSQNNDVPVQNLTVGSKILSYDTADRKFIEEKVTGINVTNVTSIFNIDNGLLYVSGANDQPIYVKLSNGTSEWVMVGALNTSDMIFDPLNNTWITVSSIQIDHGNFTVYDLTGSKIYTSGGYERSDYIANGILLDVKLL